MGSRIVPSGSVSFLVPLVSLQSQESCAKRTFLRRAQGTARNFHITSLCYRCRVLHVTTTTFMEDFEVGTVRIPQCSGSSGTEAVKIMQDSHLHLGTLLRYSGT